MIGLVGIVFLLAVAVLFSRNRKAINKRTVIGAFLLQFGIGVFILLVPVGKDVLAAISEGVQWVLAFANEGISFVLGPLATFKIGFIFAINVLAFIIFFAAFMSVLYYLGIMQIFVKVIGGGLHKLLGTSKAESMSAAANIFVGQTEAPLLVKPYILNMTSSELFAVMVGGLASVAGAVLAGYFKMGVPMEYLIAASFMAAPGGLLFAKLLVPETEKVNENIELDGSVKHENVLDAAADGATSGMSLAINVAAMLIAFVSLIALLNGTLGVLGNGINSLFDMPVPFLASLSLTSIFGFIFSPVAWLIGVPWEEAGVAGSILGQKLVVNEFVAYSDLVKYFPANIAESGMTALSPKTIAILSFALCGFANLSSIAILLGGLGALVPSRRSEIAKFGIIAVLGGSLSNLMSAAIAGLFILG
ncbi:MAG: NupC/NupG family nucleoside CNT transporter [Campylobacterales bacterium]|nr:NupC/NupG family nucleoside CNT transporter [Campylobacterales bacterium]NQY52519.1 NupC/NupG family nucleoside CNT transporter [Campylobacteraceae bacterium]